MKKLKYVKSLVIASLVVSLASGLFGIYQLINNEYLFGLAFLFGGIAMGWDDCKIFFTKNKPQFMMYGGFDNNPTDFEKKVSKKQAKWIVIVIVTILISLIIFGL